MACFTDNGAKGYRFASYIYDPVLERYMGALRKITLEFIGLAPGDKVLDVCCGTGRQAELFSETGAEVHGVEISDYMIARAKRKEKQNLTFAQADAAATGFDDSYFDFAATGFSLYEVEKSVRIGFLNEMMRVTKPGGFLLFTDFSVQTRGGFKNRMRKGIAHTMEWIAGGEHYRNYSEWMKEGGLEGFLTGKKLRVEKTIPLNGGHILIVKAVNIK